MTKHHILRDVGSGVVDEKGKFYPFRPKLATSSTDLLAAKPNIRYYLKSASITANKSNIVAAGAVMIQATIGIEGLTNVLYVGTPPTLQATDHFGIALSQDIGCLTKLNTAVTTTITNDTGTCHVVYAEILENEGEYGAS